MATAADVASAAGSTIDLRSDTVTRPTAEMRAVMVDAPVGDDVYGEDPTVNRLQEEVADLLGKERALFVPTGVMSNQLCLKALTEPGDEVILGHSSHIFNYETGAPALLSGIQLHTVADDGGVIGPADISEAIREDAYYLPPTRVIALEQTHNREGGAVVPMETIEAVAAVARRNGIAMHLDGARLWNATVATGIAPSAYARQFDTVSVCLSKALGAPVGSVLAGPAEVVTRAHRFRKIWGGGWRQAGMLAAAGLFALEHNIDRLADDHRKARLFADRITASDRIILAAKPQTNIVIFRLRDADVKRFVARLADEGILLSAAFKGAIRAVFHMDVSEENVRTAADRIAEHAEQLPPRTDTTA